MTVLPAVPGGVWERRYLDNNEHGGPFSLHPSGIQVSFCDGRVQGMSREIELAVLIQLACCDDGTIIKSKGIH